MATTFNAPQERAVSATEIAEKNMGSGGVSPLQPLLAVGASSHQQMEVMERLKQLMAWQEKQKASLFRQQQEQIMQLHKQHQVSEHGVVQQENGPEENWEEEEEPWGSDEDTERQPQSSQSPETSPEASPRKATNTHGKSPAQEGTSMQSNPGLSGQRVKERPLKPGIGKNLASFEDLVETSLKGDNVDPVLDCNNTIEKPAPKRPFLKRGEGIARFGLKGTRVRFKKKPLQQQQKGQLAQGMGQLAQGDHPQVKCLRSMSSPLLNSVNSSAGILAGQDGSDPRFSTPMSLVRCSSEDSFVMRRDRRLKVENEELHEFEMLEEAANMSFSSELSLFNDLPKHLPFCQPGAGSTDISPRTKHMVSKSTTCHPEPVNEDENEHGASVDLDETLKFSPSLAKGVEFNDQEAWESFSHGSPQSCHRTESSGSDVTLSHFSPLSQSGVWKSPVKKEILGRTAGFTAVRELDKSPGEGAWCDLGRAFNGSTGNGNCITAVEKCKVVEAPGMASGSISAHSSTHVQAETDFADYHCHTADRHSHTSESGDSSSSSGSSGIEPVQSSLPPPSALVSKLFPVLRRVDKQPNATPGHATLVNSPSPISSTEGDSGIRSLSSTSVALSEDLKYKLTQLEEEIARYRAENASLERLRKERQDAVAHLRQEIAEFKRQKNEEISKFEEYKKEEVKKLKKERKIFEVYQHEAKAARDKKDKDDIETLRRELLDTQEDARHSEARWGATFSRYRIKIQSLEEENHELKEDLRMMEQERLRTWQLQVEQEVLAKKNSLDRTGHSNHEKSKDAGRKQTRPKPVRKPNAVQSSFPNIRQSHAEKKTQFSPPRRQGSLQQSPLCENLSHASQRHNRSLESDSDASSVSDHEISVERKNENRVSGYQSDSENEISEMANEIVMRVIEGDRGVMGRNVEHRTSSARPRSDAGNPPVIHRAWQSDNIQHATENAGAKRTIKKSKSVRFSVSPPSTPASSSLPSTPPSPRASAPPLPPAPVAAPVSGGDTEPARPKEKHTTLQWKQVVPSTSKSEVVQPDGSKVVTFSNGTRKVLSADGKSSSVYFFNGDVKHVKPDQTVMYYYSEYKVTQTNYPDGLEVVDFPNKQCEKHYPNGTKEIHFPNDTVKYVYSNGEEESVFPDGLSQRNYANGDVTLRLPNGVKEYYTSEFKRREYPDGTVKTVYPDGKQETHYASGRVKVKDKNGRIIT